MRKDLAVLIVVGLPLGVSGRWASGYVHPRDLISNERAPIEALSAAKAASEARLANQVLRLKDALNANPRFFAESSAEKTDSAAILAVATSDNTASIPLFVDRVSGFDRSYGAMINIGSPVQEFLVIMDSGSSDLWLMGPNSSNNHTLYDPSKSSTYQATSYTFDDVYAKGESVGQIGLESVEIGNFTVTGQPIGVAQTVDISFLGTPKISGIFGLAWATIANIGTQTWLDSVVAGNLLAEPYFSMVLGRGTGGVNDAESWQSGGELCLGCAASVADGQVGSATVLPLLAKAWWEVAMDGVTVGGQMVIGTNIAVIIDSGTSLIELPTSTCQAIAQAVGGLLSSDGFVAVPTTISFGTIEFVLGGTSFSIAPADLVLGLSTDGNYYILGIGALDQNDLSGNPLGILGAVFMKSVRSDFWYTYNSGNPAVVLSPITGSSTGGSILSQTAITSGISPVTVTDVQTTSRASISGGRASTGGLATGTTTTSAAATATSNAGRSRVNKPSWASSLMAMLGLALAGGYYL